jgi:hypothetical protein
MGAEYVKITDCPKCKGQHRYRLEVKRAVIIKMLTMSDMNERSRAVRVTRLFTCPKTRDDYQATFPLTDTSSNRIENVSVVGEAGEDEQE